ncbi:MAG: hypothetical protein PVH88_26685 [Ignavibacteria bacterium]|jgi:lipopolysaccharide export LptBFGC system permease protein LptF
MALLEEKGFTIIETLVSIFMLGLILTLTIIFFNNTLLNSTFVYKNEAFYLANNEIERTINSELISDTTYTNKSGSLIIKREVLPGENMLEIIVTVTAKINEKEIVVLTANKRNEEVIK